MDDYIRPPDNIYTERLIEREETEEEKNLRSISKRREANLKKKQLKEQQKEEEALRKAIEESIREEERRLKIKQDKEVLIPLLNRLRRIRIKDRNNYENTVFEVLELHYDDYNEDIRINDHQLELINHFLFDNYTKPRKENKKTIINDETYNYIISHLVI